MTVSQPPAAPPAAEPPRDGTGGAETPSAAELRQVIQIVEELTTVMSARSRAAAGHAGARLR